MIASCILFFEVGLQNLLATIIKWQKKLKKYYPQGTRQMFYCRTNLIHVSNKCTLKQHIPEILLESLHRRNCSLHHYEEALWNQFCCAFLYVKIGIDKSEFSAVYSIVLINVTSFFTQHPSLMSDGSNQPHIRFHPDVLSTVTRSFQSPLV